MDKENKIDDHESKQLPKRYKGFANLSVYQEVFPVVIQTLQLLQSYKRENKQGEFDELFDKAKDKAISILTSLADGYNKYHAEDKVALYSLARSNVSHAQALMLILSQLGLVPENVSRKMVDKFDDKMKMFNGLIRKMEDKA